MNLLAAEKRLLAWGFEPEHPPNATTFIKVMKDRYVYVFFRTHDVLLLPRTAAPRTPVIQFSSLYELEVAVVYQSLRVIT